jgi:hypothetical protein
VANKLTLLGGLTALVSGALIGAWGVTAHATALPLRTDSVGLRVRIDVPRSWHRQALSAFEPCTPIVGNGFASSPASRSAKCGRGSSR